MRECLFWSSRLIEGPTVQGRNRGDKSLSRDGNLYHLEGVTCVGYLSANRVKSNTDFPFSFVTDTYIYERIFT